MRIPSFAILYASTLACLSTAAMVAAQSSPPVTSQTETQQTPGPQSDPTPVGQDAHRPFPPLSPAEQKRLDQLLGYWQKRSSNVKTYSCQFVRWEYDTTFGPRDPRVARTKAEGIIRYSSPDKGEFNVTKLGSYSAPAAPNQRPTYEMKDVSHEEHWICDGDSVFELNPQKQQLIERKLPPQMKGTQIADGPLPFMFGATKEKLLTKYWMRELVPPQNRPDEYLIEAFPKTREDAAQFQKVAVILDRQTFLPNALQVFPPNYDPKQNPSRTAYVFTDRKINDPIHRTQQFLGRFISPKPPRGWKKVVEDYSASPSDPAQIDRPQMADRRADGQASRSGPPTGANR